MTIEEAYDLYRQDAIDEQDYIEALTFYFKGIGMDVTVGRTLASEIAHRLPKKWRYELND